VSLFDSHEEKARKALDAAVSHHAMAVATLEAHRLAPADPGDATAQKEWKRTEADLIENVEIAAGVVAHWQGVVAKHEAEAAERAAKAEHEAEDKRAEAGRKAVRQALAQIGKALALIRDEVIPANAQTAAVNARRGNRPHLLDAEQRERMIPGRTVPATYREEVRWEMGDGRRAVEFRRDASGELVPTEAGFERKVVRVQQQAESVIPARMPQRLEHVLATLERIIAGQPI